MPFKIIQKGLPWQGGVGTGFQKQFCPLSPYVKERDQLPREQSDYLHRLEDEENLAEAATRGVDGRSEPARGEITREELEQHQKESRRRLGDLEGGYFL